MSRTPFTVVTAVNSVRKLSNTADTGNTRHPCIHVKRRRRTPVTNSLQEFEKKKKRTRPSFRLKNFPPPCFLSRSKDKNKNTSSFVADSNRIKSNHYRETAIPISSPFSSSFLPPLGNARQDASRGQCRIPLLGGGGDLSELRVPFMHQKTSSDQQTGVASYPFLGARTPGLNGVTGKASETRERNQDAYNIEVMRRDSTLPASQ